MKLKLVSPAHMEIESCTWYAVSRHIVEGIFYCRSDAELYIAASGKTDKPHRIHEVLIP